EAEIKEAKASERLQRLEADRARGEEQRLLSEIALATEGAMGARTGDPSDAALEWLSKARGTRRNARDEATEQFRLGRAFQAQGSIGLAAACYRAAGPYLQELLVQEGPDGDRISGPDFIILGAARAGTTWLKKCLSYHPQAFILSGEHHYFSTASHQPPESYVGRFANAHTRFLRPGMKAKQHARPAGRLYGEKSTTYLAMPQAQIDLCAALFPKARLIGMVREPVGRVWSHLKHYKLNDVLRSLDKLSDLPPWMEVEELIRQTRYEEHLIRWARRFDPEQILLVDFARIAAEPQAVYAEVLAHIGAEPAPAPEEMDESNRTERLEMPKVLAERLASAFEQERYDVPYLRAAMQRAADLQRTRKPGEAVPRRRSARPAG
ncbi:MAG TPA: sulfotransferase, partial [Caulobacteraceae bacterium]|nr:sulfotransferase [Caulobacteraceae bacterium]